MKAKVSVQLNAAVRKGILIREPCVKCGGYGQGHHEDYSKPLEVIWLCSLHHKRRHMEMRNSLALSGKR
jgi:hypothetical protein